MSPIYQFKSGISSQQFHNMVWFVTAQLSSVWGICDNFINPFSRERWLLLLYSFIPIIFSLSSFFLPHIIYQLNFLGYKVYFIFCSVSYKATNKEYSLNDKFTDWLLTDYLQPEDKLFKVYMTQKFDFTGLIYVHK